MKDKDDMYILELVRSVYTCANSLTLLILVNDIKGNIHFVMNIKSILCGRKFNNKNICIMLCQ